MHASDFLVSRTFEPPGLNNIVQHHVKEPKTRILPFGWCHRPYEPEPSEGALGMFGIDLLAPSFIPVLRLKSLKIL